MFRSIERLSDSALWLNSFNGSVKAAHIETDGDDNFEYGRIIIITKINRAAGHLFALTLDSRRKACFFSDITAFCPFTMIMHGNYPDYKQIIEAI